MVLTWDEGTKRILSDNPNVYVLVLGQSYNQDYSDYVVYWHKKRFGFATTSPAERTPDGRRIWEVCALLNKIYRPSPHKKTYVQKTLFVSQQEQDKVLEFIEMALSSFHGRGADNINVCSELNYTSEVLKNITSGNYIAAT